MDFITLALIALIACNFVQLGFVLWLVRDLRVVEGMVLDVGITLANQRHPAGRHRAAGVSGPPDLPIPEEWR